MINHEPADLSKAFCYLEMIEKEDMDIDWNLISRSTIYSDILLIGIMYRVSQEAKQQK